MDRMITENLKEMYGVNEDELFPYITLRNQVLQNKVFHSEIIPCEIARFIIKELNISEYDDSIIYQDKEYGIKREVLFVVESLKQRATDYIEVNHKQRLNVYLRNKMDHIRDIALKKKAYKYPVEHVNTYYMHYGLMEINEMFDARTKESSIIEGIKYSDNHNPFERTEEEKLEMIINSIEMKTTRINYLTESSLEDYLMLNLNKIEEGLKFISRQVVLPKGRIDILARDKNNKIAVIELKVEEDKDILWQSVYYPEEMEKKYGKENVRMIVVTPKLSSSLKRMLGNISKAEIFTFTPLIKHGKVIDLKAIRA